MVEQQKLSADFQRDRRLPQIDAVGALGMRGADSTVSGVLPQLRDADYPYYSLGLTLSVPWNDRRTRSTVRSAEARTHQAELRVQQARQIVLSQIDSAIFSVETSFEQIAATRQAREYAEAAHQAETDMLANGKSTTFVVLLQQRNLTNARADEIRALAQ